MKKIIYTRPDGGLSVVTPVINTHSVIEGKIVAVPEDISEQKALERAVASLPDYARTSYEVVEVTSIPEDRTFRNAWKFAGGKVEHDMEKCRQIHKEKLRALRAPLLQKLDVEYVKASERGDAELMKSISAKKQALRDVTGHPSIASAKTVEELKAAVPSVLTDFQ